MCTMCVQGPQRSEEGTRSSRTGVTDGCDLSCGLWELIPGPLQEQESFVTTELSLVPLNAALQCSEVGAFCIVTQCTRMYVQASVHKCISQKTATSLSSFLFLLLSHSVRSFSIPSKGVQSHCLCCCEVVVHGPGLRADAL